MNEEIVPDAGPEEPVAESSPGESASESHEPSETTSLSPSANDFVDASLDNDESAFELLIPPDPGPLATEAADPITRRRADIDARQAIVAKVLEEMKCEGTILLMPAHLSWFTGGINIRGLIADTERPGIYTTGRARWLLCANTDVQRLFEEELDGLGFQLKEWQWGTGRAVLLGELAAGKAVAADRPFPNLPVITDRLRAHLRPLLPFDQERYRELGQIAVHAVEATGRTMERGVLEAEVAGQIAHRLHRHGAEAIGLSIAADGRGSKFRRAGFSMTPVMNYCVLQATAARDGMHVTAARVVCFGPPSAELQAEHDTACKLSAIYRSFSLPGETVPNASAAGRTVLANTPYEYEWRHTPPCYGTGWFPAEELRRQGQDEYFVPNQPLVWQARIESTAVVDTVLVHQAGPVPITPTEDWPFKRIKVRDVISEVPDLLIR